MTIGKWNFDMQDTIFWCSSVSLILSAIFFLTTVWVLMFPINEVGDFNKINETSYTKEEWKLYKYDLLRAYPVKLQRKEE